MMGTKEQYFVPLINASLEDLVPADHFYRHLEGSTNYGVPGRERPRKGWATLAPTRRALDAAEA